MADERIRLCRSIDGNTQIRVDRLLLQDQGREWLYTELGKRRHVIIPIRKEET